MPRRVPASQAVIDAEFRPEPGYVAPQQPQPVRQRGGVTGLRFRGFGDAAPASAADLSYSDQVILKAQLYATIVSLRGALAVAQARVAATPSTSTSIWAGILSAGVLTAFLPNSAPADTIEGVANALNTMSGVIDARAAAIDDVMAGSVTPQKWFASCQIVKDGIDSILQELNDSDTMALLNASWEDTKQTLAQLKFPLAAGGSLVTIVILGFVGLIAYQYLTAGLRFLPPKRMSGYKPKSRKKRKIRRVKSYVLY